MPLGNRFDRKKTKTREKIFQVAVKLFLEQGYEKTTVEQICEKADVAKGTFFNHFPTKGAVLANLGEQRLMMLEDMLVREFKHRKSAREKILSFIRILGQVNEENKKVTTLVVQEILKNNFSSEMAPERQVQHRFKILLEDIVKEGQRQGEFYKGINAGYVADILVSIYFYLLNVWLGGQMENSLTDEYLARVDIVLCGIGGQLYERPDFLVERY